LHDSDDLSRRDEPRFGEFLLNCVYAEEMIAMAMGRVDRRQIFASGRDPVDKFLVLIDRDGGIHKHGIALTRDKC
jgi:hypothetical protein